MRGPKSLWLYSSLSGVAPAPGSKVLPNPSSNCVAPSFAPKELPILVALVWGAPSGKGMAWATGALASFFNEFSM